MKWLLKELDPRHDFDRYVYEPSLVGLLKDINTTGINVGKSIVRGATAGIVLGTVAGIASSLMIGRDLSDGALEGAMIGWYLGAEIDTAQYGVRYFLGQSIETIRKNINNKD